MFLMAPVTAVWGALMFGEPFGAQTALGLAVALAAVLVVRRGAGPGDRPAERVPDDTAKAAAGARR